MPPAGPAGLPPSPVTARAVCLGIGAGILICLLSAYNDCYLSNTLLVGNYFPVASIVLVCVLALGVNAAARRYLGVAGLSHGELMLVWSLVGITGSVSSYSCVGYFPSFVVAPAYYASPANEWGTYIVRHLPDWMVVSRDPNHPALRWFMEGLPRGRSIPWGSWIGPIAAWGGFVLVLYASNLALCAVFFRQWSVRERLIFPIVHMPAEVAADPAPGRLLNRFFRNPGAWAGIAIPVLLWGWKGLRSYVTGLPDFPLSWNLWSIFPDRPWSEFRLLSAEVFFSAIGLSFLLTREVGLSFWLFYVLYRASWVFVAWLGAGGTGFFGNWWTGFTVFQASGGMFAVAAFMCWTARRSLAAWLRRAVTGRSDPVEDAIPPWLSLLLIAGGFLAMTLWHVVAGAQFWVGALATACTLVMLLVMGRVVAESGMLFLSSITEPFRVITGLFPASWISGASLASLVMHRGIIAEDTRKILMPHLVNGLRAAEEGGLPLRRVLPVFALAAALGVAAGGYGFITTSHKYGATNVESWAAVMAPMYYFGDAANRQKNPPEFAMLKIGTHAVCPTNLAHMVVGAALVGGMLVLRGLFAWWPLHPFGFIFCSTWAIQRIWFSILIGWLCKTCVMGFGGAPAYRRILPFFIGLAIGECTISVILTVAGLLTGIPGIPCVP
ncbi:MAG: DUF6785 family protein [Candidatus Coatesbacteria bacterium]